MTVDADGCASARIFENETELTVDPIYLEHFGLGVYGKVRFCYSSERNEYTLHSGDSLTYRGRAMASTGLSGDRGGLGTGTIAGIVRFDNFVYEIHGDAKPGCPKCSSVSCAIGGDSFDRSNSDFPGCDWDEVAGDWDIVSDTLYCSGSAAMVKYRRQHPLNLGRYNVHTTVKADNDGDTAKIYIGPTEDDGVFAQIEFGTTCGKLRLFKREGGTDTEYGDASWVEGLVPDTEFPVQLCMDDASKRLTVILSTATPPRAWGHVARDIEVDLTAAFVYLGADGGITFDNFSAARLEHDTEVTCPDCNFSSCEIYADEFDDSAIACIWEQVAGVWTESTTGISTASDGAVLKCRAGHPGVDAEGNPDDTQGILVRFRVPGGWGAKIRAMVDYVDEDNYHYAELTLRALDNEHGSFAIGVRSGGVDTVLDSFPEVLGAEESALLQLAVCYDQNLLKGSYTALSGPAPGTNGNLQAEDDGLGGKKTAFGTGDLNGATATFTDFLYHHMVGQTPCIDCPSEGGCGVCADESTPRYFLISIAYTPNESDSACCAVFEGNWLIPLVNFTGVCWYYLHIDTCGAGGTTIPIGVSFRNDPVDPTKLQVIFGFNGLIPGELFFGWGTFAHTIAISPSGPVDCMALMGDEFLFEQNDSIAPGIVSSPCDFRTGWTIHGRAIQ